MADVLKRTVRARVRTTSNDIQRYDQEFLESDTVFTEIAQHRIVVGVNASYPSDPTPGEVDMSNIATGAVLMLETDRPITVYLNQSGPSFANGIVLGTNGLLMLVGTITSVHVMNTDPNYTVTLEFLVTD